MFVVDVTEFNSVCFWIELRQFLARQKYHSSESLCDFCSLAYNVLIVSGVCVFQMLITLQYL
jgi:hypothetical protein